MLKQVQHDKFVTKCKENGEKRDKVSEMGR